MLLMPLELAQGSLDVFVLLVVIWTLTVTGDAVPSKLFALSSQHQVPLV